MMPTSAGATFPAIAVKTPHRVLVIDDESLIRWSLTTALRLDGFDAQGAADADAARNMALRTPHPDLVLLDSRLWNTDLSLLLDELREIAPACQFFLLVVPEHEFTLRSWAGVSVICKPFDLHHVVDLVRAATTCALAEDPAIQRD